MFDSVSLCTPRNVSANITPDKLARCLEGLSESGGVFK